jgi:predicted dehydrogenase
MIKFGIIGTGNIAGKFTDAVNFTENAELYAVASRTLEKADNFAKKYNISKFYGDYESLAKDENIDVIYVATPMSEHFKNIKLCLENDKNVICEKTICVNSGEFQEVIEIAKTKKLFLAKAMWTKFLPSFKKAIEWKNRIGEIKIIKANFNFFSKYDENSRLFNKDLGGGACLDLLVYPLTLITSFLGFDYKNLKTSAYMKNGVDIDETVILEYENAYATANVGFCNNSDNTAVIVGTGGRIEFGSGFWYTENVKLFNADGALVEDFNCPHKCNGYEYEVEEFVKCLKNKQLESKTIPLSETLKILEIMDECREIWNN